MLKHKKIILGLLMCVFTFLGLFQVVYAADKDKKEEDLEYSEICIKWKREQSSVLKNAFGLKVTYTPENPSDCSNGGCEPHPKTFNIIMNGDSVDNSKKGAQFYLSKVELIEMNDNLKDGSVKRTYEGQELKDVFHLDSSNIISTKNGVYIPNVVNEPVRYRFTLVLVSGTNSKDETFVNNCGKDAKMEIYIDYDYFGEPVYMSDGPIESIVDENGKQIYAFDDASLSGVGPIDCNKSYNKGSFEEAFCTDWKEADNSGIKVLEFNANENTYAKLANKNKLASTIQYKCDAFAPLNKPNNTTDEKNTNYYTNKNYLRGSIKYTVSGTYEYNYGGFKVTSDGKLIKDEEGNVRKVGNNVVKEPASCEVQCDEVVTTEYGPPVASKAGLCFEYKVKVTSRVNCHVAKYPEKPKTKQPYCTPAPGCDHGNGYVDRAAGPNEDFEACIDKCDGGKYTEKCSTKCYNEVYGKAKSSKTSLELDYNNKYMASFVSFNHTKAQDTEGVCQIHKVDEAEKKNGYVNYYDYGRYYYNGDNIKWAPDTKLGRWYCINDKSYIGMHACIKTSAEGGGISSVCGCSAQCIWYGCSKNSYLNANESIEDDKRNTTAYNTLVAACTSYSKCSTSQAEFSIDVDYTYGDKNTTKKIYFPYTSNNDSQSKDTIQYNDNDKSITCTGKNSTSTILQAHGCYTCAGANEKSGIESTKTSNHWYQTEWSFPGTWIHNKTGEISYKPITQPGWVKYRKKFCIPLDANNVNQKWWNAYYISRYGQDKAISYFATSTLSDKCSITSCDGGAFTKGDVSNIKYNINAHTRKFGLLQWDIDISCFYALNKNFPKHENGTSCTFNDAKCAGESTSQQMKIRSVELTNLFPSSDGTVSTSSEQTGRTPGYNWSVYATNILKDKAYSSRPDTYTKWVQKKGYNVYSDEYLDYEFNLTKEDIKKIKSAGENYTAFKGETMLNSVINYRSSLFRGNNAIIHSDMIPDESTALKCNNMKNWRSNECDDFAEDGE